MANRSFDLEEFVDNPHHDLLLDIRKTDWVSLAKHYEIRITTTMRKEEIKNVVVESLIEQGVLPDIALQNLTQAGLAPTQDIPEVVTPARQAQPTAAAVLDADRLFELEKRRLQYAMEVDKERERQTVPNQND